MLLPTAEFYILQSHILPDINNICPSDSSTYRSNEHHFLFANVVEYKFY